MALLDLFKRTRRTEPTFGELVFRHGGWGGQLLVPEFRAEPIALRIEASKAADFTPLRALYDRIAANLDHVKAAIADEAHKTYCWYLDEDRRAGNVTDAELADYPKVALVEDVWDVLTPFAFGLADQKPEYNWYLALDVYWANPHYFRAQFQDLKLVELAVDG